MVTGSNSKRIRIDPDGNTRKSKRISAPIGSSHATVHKKWGVFHHGYFSHTFDHDILKLWRGCHARGCHARGCHTRGCHTRVRSHCPLLQVNAETTTICIKALPVLITNLKYHAIKKNKKKECMFHRQNTRQDQNKISKMLVTSAYIQQEHCSITSSTFFSNATKRWQQARTHLYPYCTEWFMPEPMIQTSII